MHKLRHKDALSGISSWVLVSYVGVIMMGIFITSNPVYQLVFLLISALIMYFRGKGRELFRSFLFGGVLAISVFLLNLIFSGAGETVLWESKEIPLLGQILITREVLVYSFGAALKLGTIIVAFSLYSVVVGPDRTFVVMSRVAPRSALITAITSFLIPRMKRRLSDALLAMRSRGSLCVKRSWISRIHSHTPILRVLILGALDDAWSVAESLSARAYGVGPRSIMANKKLGSSGILFLICTLLGASFISFACFYGNAISSFFPRTNLSFAPIDVSFSLGLIFVFLLPWMRHLQFSKPLMNGDYDAF